MRAADGVFVPLAQILRGEPACEDVPSPAVGSATHVPEPQPLPGIAELAREVRVFRARLADAFDDACDALLREFAAAVLGRELILAPPDIATIAARVMAEHPRVQPLRLRVAPSDLPALAQLAATLPPLTSDSELAPGDAILEFASGPEDARLGVRLAALLESAP